MARSWLSWRTAVLVVMPTLVLVVAVAAFYVITIQGERQSRQTDSYLREMAVLAEQFEGVLTTKASSAGSGIKDGMDKAVRDKTLKQNFSRLGLGEPRSDANTECADEQLQSVKVSVCVSAEREPEQTKSMTDSNVTASGWPARNRLSVVRFCGLPLKSADNKPDTPPCGELAIGTLIDPLVDASSFRDENVFIAIGNTVMYERGDRSLRLTDTSSIKSAANDKEPTAAAHAANDKDATAARAPELNARSVAIDADIGGRAFKLVSQPLLFSSTVGAKLDVPWVMGALIAREHFDSKVNAPSWTWAGYATLFVALLALAIPIVKVATIGKGDLLAARDVRLLAASLVLLTGGATATLYWRWAHGSLETALDHELDAVASQLRDNFLREVRQVSSALDLYSNEWVAPQLGVASSASDPDPHDGAGTVPCDGGPTVLGNLFAAQPLADGKPCGPLSHCPSPEWQRRLKDLYPYVSVISWAHQQQPTQREKWSITRFPAAPISTATRPWFVDALADRVWRLPPESQWPQQPIAVHMLNSLTLGGIVPTVSKRYTDGNGNAYVANLVPHLISLTHPVLPAGFSFAVIQPDGRVVFHSSPARRLYENFYAEGTLEQDVRAAIEATRNRDVAGEYHGEQQVARVIPIDFSPWTLVAMRDKGAQDRQSLDVLFTWIVEFAAYVAVLALLYALWLWRGGIALGEWLWPKLDQADAYRAAALRLAIGVALALAVIEYRTDWSPLSTLVTVVLIATTCCALALARIGRAHAPAPPAKRVAKHDGGYRRIVAQALWLLVVIGLVGEAATGNLLVCAVATMAVAVTLRPAWAVLRRRDAATWQEDFLAIWLMIILLVAALPSALMLQDSWDMGMEIFVRNGQLRFSADLRDLERQNKEEYTSPGSRISDELLQLRQIGWIGRGPDEQRLDKDADTNTEIVTSGIFGGVLPCSGDVESREVCVDHVADAEQPDGWQPLWAWTATRPAAAIMSWLPIREEDAIHTRALVDAAGADERWSWKRVREGSDDHAELCSYRRCFERAADWQHGPFDTSPGHTHMRSRIKSTTPFPSLQTLAAIPAFTTFGSLDSWYRTLIVLGALLAAHLGLSMLGFLGRQVIGLDQSRGAAPGPAPKPEYARGLLVVQRDLPVPSSADVEVVDLAHDDACTTPAAAPTDTKAISATKLVVIRNLDAALADPQRRDAAVRSLEDTLSRSAPSVIVHSATDPLTILVDEARRAPGRSSSLARWARLLERLSLLPARAARQFSGDQLAAWADVIGESARTGTAPPPRPDWPSDRAAELADECQWTARLRGIEAEMLAQGVPEEGMVSRLDTLAAAHYHAIWSALADDEQTMLIHLARGAYVNPRSWRLARGLVHEGLVRFGGPPQLMNASFRRFVDERAITFTAHNVDAPSQWDRIRDPLYYLLIAGGLLVYFTQPEGWTRLVGFLSAIGSVTTKFTEASGIFGRLKPPAPTK